MEQTFLPNPGKHVFPKKRDIKLAPSRIISKNDELGEILKYWGRNVFSNSLFEETALTYGCNTIRSSDNLFFAETGHRRMSVYAQTPMETSPKDLLYTRSKSLAKFLYERDGHQTPLGRSFTSRQKAQAVAYAEKIGFPVVLKPNSGHGGHGVMLDLSSPEAVAEQIDALGSPTGRFLIERQLKGKDHRFLVAHGKTIAVWQRIPANIIGDGVSTIEQLTIAKNKEKSYTFSRLKLNDESLAFLKDQGLAADSVLAEGRQVFFNNKENLTQGGDAVQMLDGVHPSYYEIAERIAASTPNYEHLAVDMMLEDCTVAATSQNWAVLETNSRPDILGGQYPDTGRPLPLSEIIFTNYAKGRLDLRTPSVAPLNVTMRLHSRAGAAQIDRVLEAVSSSVPLEIHSVDIASTECALMKITATPRYLSYLSSNFFHPAVENGHYMLETLLDA